MEEQTRQTQSQERPIRLERTDRSYRAPRRPYPPTEGREGRDTMGMRRFAPPIHRVCPFCHDPNKRIDYKDGDALRRFLNDRGKIKPRRRIGTCARHQRRLALAIKRARVLALITYAPPHIHGV